MIEPAKSIGEVQRYLDCALGDHMVVVWGQLIRAGLCPPLNDWHKEDYEPPVGHIVYHVRAVERYIRACHEGLIQFVGDTEGQLCPYDDCCHDLAIESAGWCKCGFCQRPFYADDSDGDFEDYHCRRPKGGEVIPEALLFCRDLGPSWGTPKNALNSERERVFDQIYSAFDSVRGRIESKEAVLSILNIMRDSIIRD